MFRPSGSLIFRSIPPVIIVISKGSLLFVRHIPIGIKAIMEGADAPAKLQDEFKKSMDAFTQEDGSAAPISYVVTTAHEAVGNILPVLKESLKVDLQGLCIFEFHQGFRPPCARNCKVISAMILSWM